MSDQDHLRRFLFEELGVRGELVHMDASWQSVLAHHDYPEAVRGQLGQALAAALLLSATIKFEGALILQAQGDGPLHTLVAQATHRRTVRGLARWEGELKAGASLAEMYGQGRLVLTLQNEGAEPYQGIVSLEGGNLAEALQTYFEQSEQLPTRFWLAADGNRAVGLFLQELPGQRKTEDGWNRLNHLADTVTEPELLNLPVDVLLRRLFHQEDLRVFDPEPVAFRCSCSRERIESVLKVMGREEVEASIQAEGNITVDCEFCNRQYRFDLVDVEALFAADHTHPAPRAKH